MIVSRREIEELSIDIRRIIDGHAIDLRDNLEGRLSILKNDIHTLAGRLNEQALNLEKEKVALADALADISHQLKTPLTAMMVMTELLEKATPEKAAEFTKNIKQGLTQTGWLVSALLKMAKLESGSVNFSKSEVTINNLLDLSLQPLRILLDIKDQRVELEGDTVLICDKNWTAQALTNIIKNASEYSPQGSLIEVTSGKNPIASWITVRDMGKGIPTHEIKNLFKRYGDSKQGTGIGLPLALAIMQGQNGDLEVDGGGKDKGAAFTMKFYGV